MKFVFPYFADKSWWPHEPDGQNDENLRLQRSSVGFAGLAFRSLVHVDVWRPWPANSVVGGMIRNFVAPQPFGWIGTWQL